MSWAIWAARIRSARCPAGLLGQQEVVCRTALSFSALALLTHFPSLPSLLKNSAIAAAKSAGSASASARRTAARAWSVFVAASSAAAARR